MAESIEKSPVCDSMKITWVPGGVEEADENELNDDRKERSKKRRKMLKGLKKWTGQKEEGERRFKGWSDSGHQAFVRWTQDIREDVKDGTHALWEKAYKEIHLEQLERRRVEMIVVRRYEVDKTIVWEL